VGAPSFGATVPLDVNYFLNGRRVVGITEGDSQTQAFIPALVSLYQQGRLPLEELIRHYPFEELEQAASDAHRGDVIKPVLLYD
jgi:aryl-alcohol dehydrogenase